MVYHTILYYASLNHLNHATIYLHIVYKHIYIHIYIYVYVYIYIFYANIIEDDVTKERQMS